MQINVSHWKYLTKHLTKIFSVAQVLILYLNCFFSFIMFGCSAPHCKEPINLEARHRTLFGLRNKFISTSTTALHAKIRSPERDLDKSYLTSIDKSKDFRNRSLCPWYQKVVYDKNLIPSQRIEAECRCKHCQGNNRNYHCVKVYTKMSFLNRTGVCVDGFYVYKLSRIKVASACVCARKIDRTVP